MVEDDLFNLTELSPAATNLTAGTEDGCFSGGTSSNADIADDFGFGVHNLGDTFDLSRTSTNIEDFAFWPGEQNVGLVQDANIVFGDSVPLLDGISQFCSPSAWLPEPQSRVEEQTEQPQTALTVRAARPPKLLYTPVDLSTTLMEYWFSDVCPMWSAFDSPSNPHRQLASTAWQHSEAVFYALQSMSAACMMDSLPQVKKYVSTLSTQAVEAIQRGVRSHKQLGANAKAKFPRELLLSIIAMGTSVCWTDTRQLGLWFLARAHDILSYYDDESTQLNEDDQQELGYFREALVYWEMLYRVVGSDPQGHLKTRKEIYMKRLRNAMSVGGAQSLTSNNGLGVALHTALPSRPSKGLTIHPWTGISTDIQHTFGLVILLCREHCRGGRRNDRRTTAALTDALCDINLARDLARELADTNVYSADHATSSTTFSKGTGDSTTPIEHLVDTAEAYRLAGLLLLFQTFSDLETEGLVSDVSALSDSKHSSMGGSPGRKRVSLALTMKLVETLRRVPAESGTRCIQPILYICAGSGLKFDTVEGEDDIPAESAGNSGAFAESHITRVSEQIGSRDIAVFSAANRPPATDIASATVTKCTLEVSRGRRFVVDRLCALQRSLPPRPIGVALDLVKAIWAEYDYPRASEAPHWIDVMVEKGFQTLFG